MKMSSTSHEDSHHSAPGTGDPTAHIHVVPPSLLLSVYFALVVLTVLTVSVTWFDLGKANIYVAMGIAVVKASLVLLYFMHLRWDSPFNAIALIAALVFVGVFIGATMTDSANYSKYLTPPPGVTAP
jgi:cytochrome c oxidase subunit IV